MINDPGEDIGEICVWIAAVEFCGFDEREDIGGALSTTVGTGEQPVFALMEISA